MAPGIFDSLFNMGLFQTFNGPWGLFLSITGSYIKLKLFVICQKKIPLQEDLLINKIHSLKKFHNKDSKTNHTYMSIVKFWHVFCTILSQSLPRRFGTGPLGPVRKILVVRSGPEGPQFARSVGTLAYCLYQTLWSGLVSIDDQYCLFFQSVELFRPTRSYY